MRRVARYQSRQNITPIYENVGGATKSARSLGGEPSGTFSMLNVLQNRYKLQDIKSELTEQLGAESNAGSAENSFWADLGG